MTLIITLSFIGKNYFLSRVKLTCAATWQSLALIDGFDLLTLTSVTAFADVEFSRVSAFCFLLHSVASASLIFFSPADYFRSVWVFPEKARESARKSEKRLFFSLSPFLRFRRSLKVSVLCI